MTTTRIQGSYLRFFVHENRKHRGILVYEWLLERAKKMGIHGGTAFRAIAGFGKHGVMREQHFFELAGDLPVRVDFLVTPDEAAMLIKLIEEEKIPLFYAEMSAAFGVINSGG